MKESGLSTLNQFLGQMVKGGKVIWENQARDINPDHPVLAERLKTDIEPKNQSSRKTAPATRRELPPSGPAFK
jgi:hypothetical protein